MAQFVRMFFPTMFKEEKTDYLPRVLSRMLTSFFVRSLILPLDLEHINIFNGLGNSSPYTNCKAKFAITQDLPVPAAPSNKDMFGTLKLMHRL